MKQVPQRLTTFLFLKIQGDKGYTYVSDYYQSIDVVICISAYLSNKTLLFIYLFIDHVSVHKKCIMMFFAVFSHD